MPFLEELTTKSMLPSPSAKMNTSSKALSPSILRIQLSHYPMTWPKKSQMMLMISPSSMMFYSKEAKSAYLKALLVLPSYMTSTMLPLPAIKT
jgi:hypothetical protein